jgi:hypothetical protein
MGLIAKPTHMCVYREKSSTTGEITKAMAKATAEFQPVKLDSVGRDEDGREYRYASLTAINAATKPALSANGLWLHCDYGYDDRGVFAVAVLEHDTGEFVTSTLPIPQFQSIHKSKAAMTLMRRAAIEALLGLAAEQDTDGPMPEADGPAVNQAQAAAWADMKRMATDAIAAAANVQAVEAKVAKAREKVEEGAMNPADLPALVTYAEKRIKEIEAAAKKAGVKPEPVGGAK